MHKLSIQALLIEDSPTDAQLFQHVFFRAAMGDWSLVQVERLSDAIDKCQSQEFDIALMDLRLPDSDGLDTVIQFCQAIPDIPVIILTAFNDEELALQAMAQGAQDYLVKDQVTTQLLRRSIRYTLERSQVLQQLRESERSTLQALEKERELNLLKSHFIAMVSHEFRNPLSALRVISELTMNYENRLSKEQKEVYSKQVKITIDHMCQLLDEVIFLGRSESDQFQLELTDLDLTQFCTELVTSLQFSDRQQHLIQLQIPDRLPLIQLDEKLLRHILSNLLSNALKYSPANSEVTLKVGYHDQSVCFQVQDQGIGIPEQEHHRLFETFSRCSNVGSVAGTGLGLAIVKRCIDLHQGQIKFESQLDQGTIVTVKLPQPV